MGKRIIKKTISITIAVIIVTIALDILFIKTKNKKPIQIPEKAKIELQTPEPKKEIEKEKPEMPKPPKKTEAVAKPKKASQKPIEAPKATKTQKIMQPSHNQGEDPIIIIHYDIKELQSYLQYLNQHGCLLLLTTNQNVMLVEYDPTQKITRPLILPSTETHRLQTRIIATLGEHPQTDKIIKQKTRARKLINFPSHLWLNQIEKITAPIEEKHPNTETIHITYQDGGMTVTQWD